MNDKQEIEELLKAYKRYPFGTDELPHITGVEITAKIMALKQKWETAAVNDLLKKTAEQTEMQYSWSEVDNWTFEFGSILRDLYIKELQSDKEEPK